MKLQFFFLLLFFSFQALPGNAQYFQDGTTNLPDNGTQFSSMDVRAADLDGDGDLDIVLANEFQGNTILTNNGNGIFTNTTFGNFPQAVHDSEDVAIADFDQDGDMDLVFCSEDDVTIGNVNVHEYYFNDGSGSFSASPFQLPDSEANAVISTDLNNDSWPDLIFGNDGQNVVLINDQTGAFINETTDRIPTIDDLTQDLALADVDGDTDLDLFVGNENGNKLLINNGSGVFSDETTTCLPQGINMETRKVTFGDVDGDGDQDVYLSNVAFITGKNRQNRLYLNDGNGIFTDKTETHLPAELNHSLDAVFIDVNSDNDLDLIVCGITISNNAIVNAPVDAYLNDGSGMFTKGNDEVFGADYLVKGLGLFSADFNGDGKTDIYICDRRDNNSVTKDVLMLGATLISANGQSIGNETISLFPNPGDTTFTVLFNGISVTNPGFGLYNPSGKLVGSPKVERPANNRFVLDCSDYKLPKGIYWLLISDGGKKWFKQWRVR